MTNMGFEMSDIDDEASDVDFQRAWEAMRVRRKELAVGVNAHNRGVLFGALTLAGARTVVVDFGGYGDDGCIKGIQAYTGVDREGPIELPEASVTIHVIDIDDWPRIQAGEDLQVEDQTETLENAIHIVCFEYLEQTATGWEIKEGSFGRFTFDVDKKTIRLEFNKLLENAVKYELEL